MNSSTFNARAFEDSFSAVLVPQAKLIERDQKLVKALKHLKRKEFVVVEHRIKVLREELELTQSEA